MNDSVSICEVGMRDGLQNESQSLSVQDKFYFFTKLVNLGFRQIEIGSFVSPKAIPTMADTDGLAEKIKTMQAPVELQTLGLIMNEKGLDRTLAAGVHGVCIVAVVSESLCQKNNNCSAQESITRAVALLKRARQSGLFTRIDIGAAWVCPYEGKISLERVRQAVDQIWEYQPDELALCDSIGFAQPFEVASLFADFGERYDRSRLVAHFHDTKALGLANATAALLQGIRKFDASLGGLGGCPYVPGAKGNLASEDLVHLCQSLGLQTQIDFDQLWPLITWLEAKIGRPLGGQSRTWYQSSQSQLSKGLLNDEAHS